MERAHGSRGFKFSMTMDPDHRQNWLPSESAQMEMEDRTPFTGLDLIPAWIGNHLSSVKCGDEIIHSQTSTVA